MIDSNINCILSLEGGNGVQQMTGKDCVVESFTIDRSINSENVYGYGSKIISLKTSPEPTRITLELVCLDTNFLLEMFDKDHKPKRRISKLRVEDCSIEELMFAARQKLKK